MSIVIPTKKNAKDLKDLEETASARAIDIKDLKDLKANPFLARSAGACPPRAFDLSENRTPTKAVSRSDRGTARDRPSPYGEREAFFLP